MNGRIRTVRLQNEYERIERLLMNTQLLSLAECIGHPPENYLFNFGVKTLVENGDVEAKEGNVFIEVSCGPNYPRQAPLVALRSPLNIFHPNISFPWICWGHFRPGLYLDRLLQQIAAVLSYNVYTINEDDALNKKACAWTRSHQDRLPVDPRPFITKQESLVEVVEE